MTEKNRKRLFKLFQLQQRVGEMSACGGEDKRAVAPCRQQLVPSSASASSKVSSTAHLHPFIQPLVTGGTLRGQPCGQPRTPHPPPDLEQSPGRKGQNQTNLQNGRYGTSWICCW